MRSRQVVRHPIRVPAWFLFPAVLLYLFVVIVPSIQGTMYSFTNWNGITDDYEFVGLVNFADIFSDERAVASIGNTIFLTLLVTSVQTLLGLLLALGVNSHVKSRHLLRVLFFTPVVLTPLVAGYIWSYLLSPNGTINEALEILGLESLQRVWLGDADTALASVSIAIIWQFTGYSMVIFLAGLQAIPAEIREAALLDGAGPLRRLWSVTLPLINGALIVNVLLTMVASLSQFDHVTAMTGGGPGNATQTMSTTIYRVGIAQGNYPYGTSLAVVMGAIVAVAAVMQYRLTLRKVQF